jgi:acyl-coenzyme A synthetase/AMP-(fatty) acid ligase
VADELTIKRLQDHVKAVIAPYKYPRSVVFTDALPKDPDWQDSAISFAQDDAG